jgi:hypothetical protein
MSTFVADTSDVLGEIVSKRLNNEQPDQILPEYEDFKFLGLAK